METLRIDDTDIIFKNDAPGKGKIIISNDDYGYNFSYYWGAMGTETIQDFILEINSSYFVDKLTTRREGDIDVKKTFRNIRAAIKEALQENGIGWYNHLEFQKDLREEVNNLQSYTCDANQLVDSLHNISNSLNFYLIDDSYDRKEIESIFESMFDECWYMFEYETPRESIFLEKLHKKLQKAIKNEKRKVKV